MLDLPLLLHLFVGKLVIEFEISCSKKNAQQVQNLVRC